jgi:hypothetical protein
MLITLRNDIREMGSVSFGGISNDNHPAENALSATSTQAIKTSSVILPPLQAAISPSLARRSEQNV